MKLVSQLPMGLPVLLPSADSPPKWRPCSQLAVVIVIQVCVCVCMCVCVRACVCVCVCVCVCASSHIFCYLVDYPAKLKSYGACCGFPTGAVRFTRTVEIATIMQDHRVPTLKPEPSIHTPPRPYWVGCFMGKPLRSQPPASDLG